MVRLKGFDSSITNSAEFHFNSTMVRLKALTYANEFEAHHDFNSTMVRLKVNSVKII